jgi:hypothetical protein
VNVVLNTRVSQIICEGGAVAAVKTQDGRLYGCRSAVIATGGASYPATGSTGDGYQLLAELGHTIQAPAPSLVPIEVKEAWASELQGLSLKNVRLTVLRAGAKVYSDIGEMQFTHFGVSGPLVLTANLVFNREIGQNSGKGVGFEYAARAKYPWTRQVQFGVEAYGEPGRLTGLAAARDQEHLIGPVLLGKFNVDGVPGVFNYNVGYLFGLTAASAKGTAKWELEYEIPF